MPHIGRAQYTTHITIAAFLYSIDRKSVFSLYINQQFFNSTNRDLIISKTNRGYLWQ